MRTDRPGRTSCCRRSLANPGPPQGRLLPCWPELLRAASFPVLESLPTRGYGERCAAARAPNVQARPRRWAVAPRKSADREGVPRICAAGMSGRKMHARRSRRVSPAAPRWWRMPPARGTRAPDQPGLYKGPGPRTMPTAEESYSKRKRCRMRPFTEFPMPVYLSRMAANRRGERKTYRK